VNAKKFSSVLTSPAENLIAEQLLLAIIVRTGTDSQESQERTSRTELPGKVGQGKPGEDSQQATDSHKRTARKGQ
jgi:hypothetical protein